jgi:hypothetical protein
MDEKQSQQADARADLESANDHAAVALSIAEDLALGTEDSYNRVLISAPEAAALAQGDLDTAIIARDGFQASFDEKSATIDFMTASEIDTTTNKGAADSAKLELLASELTNLSERLISAKFVVVSLTSIVARTEGASVTAQEALDNVGKDTTLIYAEA